MMQSESKKEKKPAKTFPEFSHWPRQTRLDGFLRKAIVDNAETNAFLSFLFTKH